MYVTQLDLQQFRTFDYTQLQFSPDVNIIVGGNAAGKTTILEAVSFFAFGRSFRATQDKDVIQFGQTESRLRIQLHHETGKTDLSAKISSRGKQVAVNRVAKKSLSDLLGHLHCVTFTPDDLGIVKEGPEERRKFLNFSMAQYVAGYIKDLHLYNQLLAQRNQLLKMKQFSALDIWDSQLCEVGANVILARKTFCNALSDFYRAHYHRISGGGEGVDLQYVTDADGSTGAEVQEKMTINLKNAEVRDKQRGFTSVGPHRDDVQLLLQDRSAARFASQGQQRSITLALKLAVVDLIFTQTGDYPVLLLDDVLSELDPSRQKYLLSLVERTQTIITATDRHDLLSVAGKVFGVTHGIMQELTCD